MAVIPGDTQPHLFYGYWLAAYSFTVCFFVSSFFLHTRGIFFPAWMAEFNTDRTQMALVVSLTLFTGSCLAPIIGYLIDRFPIKLISLCGAAWLALGYLVLRSVTSFEAFFITLILFQGVAWGTLGPLMQTKLMVNWFNRNRGMAIGMSIMGISVAGIMMPTVATFLLENLGWRDSYGVYALCLIFVILPMTAILVKQDPDVIGEHPDGDKVPAAVINTPAQTSLEIYKEFLTSKAFWSVVITFGLMNGVYSAMITHLPNYLTNELTFTLYEASYVLGVAGVFAILGKVIFGWLMDHFDAKRTVMVAVTSYFASTVVFINVENYSLMMIAAGLFGLGFGGMIPVRSVLISRLFGVKKFSRVNGLLAFFLAPATFWVLITGFIADSFDTYVMAFKIWAVAFLLAGIVSALVKLPNREDAVA